MSTAKTFLTACAVALSMLGAAGAEARAQNSGVITLTNPTNSPIHYQFRWGNGVWVGYTIDPHRFTVHSHPLNAQGLAPAPAIRFHDGVAGIMRCNLQFFAARRPNFFTGKEYEFEWTGPFLDLTAK